MSEPYAGRAAEQDKKNRARMIANGGYRTKKDALIADLKLQRKDLVAACEMLLEALKQTMPGVRHIACSNYTILNDAPILARRAIDQTKKRRNA